VNATAVAEYVDRLAPTLCVVIGASVIRPPVLDVLLRANAVNLHAGRAPEYRGTHGGVWAILRNKPDDVVTTLHMLEAGIDTGKPLVYVPARVYSTMRAMAAEHREVALRWLAKAAVCGQFAVEPVEPAPRGELLYPPRWTDWRRFRATARVGMTTTR
jgi:methionyl-tRNA formyltransferase